MIMNEPSKVYELTWHVPGKVLLLRISGEYSVEDARHTNTQLLAHLDASTDNLYILINAMEMIRPYNFVAIRNTLTFMDHAKLKSIYVAASDRLVKLSMMVIFNLSRAGLHISDDMQQAETLVQQRLTQDDLLK